MRPGDLIVEVRDATLKRLGQIPAQDLRLTCSPVHLGTGTWEVELPAEHPAAAVLRRPGSGVVITGPSDVIASGPMTSPELTVSKDTPAGWVRIGGVTDDHLLARVLCFPQPSNPDATTQTAAADAVRNMAAETALHWYVRRNLGPDAPAARRTPAARLVTMGTNSGRGKKVSRDEYFSCLADVLTEIAVYDGTLGFRLVQRGAALVFETYAIRDRTGLVRLDVTSGTLASQQVRTSPPETTRAVVGGRGEGTGRVVVQRTTTASLAAEAEWGWGREEWIDQKGTEDLEAVLQAGDQRLEEAGTTATSVVATPGDVMTMRLGIDWWLGDRIAVVVAGQETASVVTGVVLKADGEGVRAAAAIGDVSGFDPAAATTGQVADTARRVSALERNLQAVTPTVPLDTKWTPLTLTSPWSVPTFGPTPSYRRRAIGVIVRVELRGNLQKSSTIVANDSPFTMPVGVRPPVQIYPPTLQGSGGSAFNVQINTTGALVVRALANTTASTWMSLDGTWWDEA